MTALPELATKRLLNDLQVIVASVPGSGDEMAVGWVLRYGSAFDPAGKGGLAYVVSGMLGKATLDRTSEDIQTELSLLGAELEVLCDWDRLAVVLRGHSSTFERSLLLLYQIIGEAQFLEADLEEVKQERMRQLDGPEDPRQRIRGLFEEELFSGTTFGRPQRGSRATLGNISLGDVKHYYNRFFSSNEAALVVAGNVPGDQVLQKTARIWGVWVRKDPVPFTFLPPRPPAVREVLLDDDPQSPAAQFILGSLCPSRGDTGYGAAKLAGSILQERLTKSLPTALVTVGLDARRMPGPFYIQAQAAADQAADQIRQILEAVEAVRGAGVTPDELESAKSRWIQEFRDGIRTPEGICRALLDAELYRLGTNYMALFEDLVRRTDTGAVQQASKEWFLPGGVLLSIRGPAASLRTSLATFGSLREATP